MLTTAQGDTSGPTPAAAGVRVAAAVAAAGATLEAWYLAIFHPASVSAPALALVVLAWGGVGLGVGVLVAMLVRRRTTALARAAPGWLVASLAGLACLGSAAALRAPATATGPTGRQRVPGTYGRANVVVVLVDTLRADHLGCLGYSRPTSPNIDRLASEGILFTRAISQASWTLPATASLLTGVFPSTHGAWSTKSRLPDDAVLLSERLQAAGYATAAFSANPHVSPGYGFAQGWNDFWLVPVVRGLRRTILVSALARVNRLVDADAALVDAALRRVARGPRNADRDQRLNAAVAAWLETGPPEPFFLYAHLMSAHRPFDPPAPWADRFTGEGLTGPTDYPPKTVPFEPARPLPAADRRELVARYDGAVLHADRMVGALLDTLERHGVLDRTLVVVTADHGEEFYDHQSWGHGHSLYQELIHVPLVLWQPGHVPAGRRIDDLVMTVDVLPTILELLGLPVPTGVAGRSLAALLRGASAGWPNEAYAELHCPRGVAQALLQRDRKLIAVRTRTASWMQRYDLARDPGEHDDLAAPVAAADLAHLRALQAIAESGALHAEPVRPGWTEPLEALGYLE